MLAIGGALVSAAAEVSFNRDVRPLLVDRCFECHGPAKAKGGLRLDQQASATHELKSGAVAVKAGRASESEILRRVRVEAGDDRMPPAESGKQRLSEKEIALLAAWIAEGA